jgi:RimJ/RimL family protein N-acetyltransferase
MQGMPVTAPELETSRLVLRGHRRDDLDDALAMWSHLGVVKYVGGHPLDLEQVWTRLLRYVGHWAVMGFGYWVVREKGTQRFVGEVGFGDFHRVSVPELHGKPEAGWAITPEAQGRGFATEAVEAAHAWISSVHGAPQTLCMIAPDNAASLRVAQKCGYRRWTHTQYRGESTLLLERRSGPLPA